MEIRVLDESTIDRIAAGEVVERPLGVVKELVENAVDAGADAITVEIKEGGMALIRVTDNGRGIEKAQVPKAFLRHATSKIRSAEDLQQLASLGFRGEALSSICAVAQVEMMTKEERELTGLRYRIEGSGEKESEEIGAPQGTTVLVRNLFYNVPARKKFLKTPQTEGGYVTELMEHLSLSHPQISFKYVLNGQIKFHTSGNGELLEVIYRLYGREIAEEMLRIEETDGDKTLSGFLGTPLTGRANRNFEICFINGRYVKSPLIAKAVEEAYKPYLMQHRFPFFVLHLELSPDRVDVNVHPAKMEVRFRDPITLSDFIFEAVRRTLSQHEMLGAIKLTEEKEKGRPRAAHVPEPFEAKARQKQAVDEESARRQDARDEEDARIPAAKNEEGARIQAAENERDTWISDGGKAEGAENAPLSVREEPVYQTYEGTRHTPVIFGQTETAGGRGVGQTEAQTHAETHGNVIKKADHILVEKPVQMNLFEEKLLSADLRDEYRIIGQIFHTYWIVELRDKLLLIDQHAAHEKVKYERICRQLREGNVLTQQVNPPVILSLSGREETILSEHMEYFEKIGFETEHFGGSEYALRGVPAELFGRSAGELFREILDELSEGPLRGEPQAAAAKLASISCKAAVKGGQAMRREEAQALIDELLSLENPYHCPHGRPTIVTMSRQELEKRFCRIV